MENEIGIRKENELVEAIDKVDEILSKSYLPNLNKLEVINQNLVESDEKSKFDSYLKDHIRFFEVSQIVMNTNESARDKLVTVFNSVGNVNGSFLMHLHGTEEKTIIQFGVRHYSENKLSLTSDILKKNLESNFPGSKLSMYNIKEMKENVTDVLSAEGLKVTSVTDIAGLRFDEETKDRQFMQGIEKFIDTMRGKEYSLLLIADPVSAADLQYSRHALENLYSSLVPFCESQYTIGTNESDSVSSSISKGTTETINNSITESVTHTIGKSNSFTKGKSSTKSVGISYGGMNSGTNSSESSSYSKSYSMSQSKNSGTTSGTSSANSETKTESGQHVSGKSLSVQIKVEDHTVKQLLGKIDETLKRYDTCADLGMWNCAAYCMSQSALTSQMAAHIYHSLLRGKNSSLENGTVVVWNKEQSELIVNELKHMLHPRLKMNGMEITPGTLVSSAELAIQAGLPNHSVPGVPVIECAEFGRTVSSFDSKNSGRVIRLGHIYNMHREEVLPVELSTDSLTSHTFITGSTGSGKSNTVYQMLDQLKKKDVHFLVVEPAKGEYKNVFGGNCDVYGTNPDISPLLRINPFSFPHGKENTAQNIHILEHLDRLIEIFNVCWPMYAAMPAVLKEAIEKSYEDAGWNLVESKNEYEEKFGGKWYPTFADVARNIKAIIDSSEYDADNKGAYKGALVTRLKSLTNGINGMVFTADEISEKDLFEENVIVDLSRVGSSETKSLIMGILVLKLQEHRMTEGTEANSALRHVTVLEEAHHLLKRTSTEQTGDGGNLLGKSVEMLTNAIAEMRTYGEGFVIADQSPGLLDMAAIRNTNTKIIMRLPAEEDRVLAGKAAGLNDDQVKELAKLPRGVAAVYQNEWVEPVLCKVEKCGPCEKLYKYEKSEATKKETGNVQDKIEIARLLCGGIALDNENKLKDFVEKLSRLNIRASTKVSVFRSVCNASGYPGTTKIAPVMAELFPKAYKTFANSFAKTAECSQWTIDISNALKTQIQCEIEERLFDDIRRGIGVQYLLNELGKIELLEKWHNEGGVK